MVTDGSLEAPGSPLPCWLGMVAVFSATFSGMVISSYDRYGPVGIVFGIMSFLLAIGVVIILGAVAGIADGRYPTGSGSLGHGQSRSFVRNGLRIVDGHGGLERVPGHHLDEGIAGPRRSAAA